jgi:sodium transport system permease protein
VNGLAGFGTIFRTTLVDQMRDRRSMGAALIYALLGPVVMLLAFTALANMRDDSETLTLAVHGAEHAPALVQQLGASGARIERRGGAAGDDFRGADAVLVIPQGFEQSIAAGPTRSRLTAARWRPVRSRSAAFRRRWPRRSRWKTATSPRSPADR